VGQGFEVALGLGEYTREQPLLGFRSISESFQVVIHKSADEKRNLSPISQEIKPNQALSVADRRSL
jgi:hypothetical protein